MGYQRQVYTVFHVLLMTGAFGLATVGMYAARHQHPELVKFIESWDLYIGIACTRDVPDRPFADRKADL